MDPTSYSATASLGTNIQPERIFTLFWYWIKGKKKEKYTFTEYFKKIQKGFKIRNFDEDLKQKVLDSIDGQTTPDGRRIMVDHNKGRILIGRFDDF